MQRNPQLAFVVDIIIGAACYFGIMLSVHLITGAPLHPKTPLDAIKFYKLTFPKSLLIWWIGIAFTGGIAALFNPFRGFDKIHGTARYAKEKDIKKMGLRNDSGVILGLKSGKWLRSLEARDTRSVTVVAPPRTGKTAGIIIPSILTTTSSFIALDIKGEIYDLTHFWRSQFSEVIRFAPAENGSMKWNPLSSKELPTSWTDIEVHISRICETLFPLPEKSTHWMEAARRIFRFWALYLINMNGETSCAEILKNVLTGDSQGAVEAALLDDNLPERIRLEGNMIIDMGDREYKDVFSTFNTQMDIFLDPRVAENTSDSDFSLSDLRKKRISVYLVVSDEDSPRLKKLLTVFLEYAANVYFRKQPDDDELTVMIYLDEFKRLGKIDKVKEIPALGAGYRLGVVFVVQTVAQLNDVYGEDGAKIFFGTTSYHVYFTQTEESSAEKISKTIGHKTVRTRSVSGKLLEVRNKTEGETGIPLIRANDIMSMSKREVLILAQNNFKRPIKAKSALWFKDQNLRKAVEWRPQEATE
ncbi:type IV secretory system conjugative DNA transfer family protein [Pseudodesulfovibrio senegalensis]|uniref:Type IV secretion system DNA-binding domain-containing protein n=1 Tax=Pseudodesulfovibrio senegalensis TaxID=1721087 RepID=A0A6N6MZ51_9BACT|nr:type IV secretory system conjugative DNA transfer family protein [Pseudodesulfovibrio senegalensis]KAB1437307.1 type IV secretion system DNA-binding domain-containing protein [Pseudodesulfovibrio senegalensis]